MPPPIIEAQGLTKRFGDTQALAGLDLVAAGHVGVDMTGFDENENLRGFAGPLSREDLPPSADEDLPPDAD